MEGRILRFKDKRWNSFQSLLLSLASDVEQQPIDTFLFDFAASHLAPLPAAPGSEEYEALIFQVVTVIQKFGRQAKGLPRVLGKLLLPLDYKKIVSLGLDALFVAALESDDDSIKEVVVDCVRKAGGSAAEIALLASHRPDVVKALVYFGLTSDGTGLATRALETIFEILAVEKGLIDNAGGGDAGATGISAGDGLFWRRVFGDRDIYRLFFSCCSAGEDSDGPVLTTSTKSIACVRLAAFVAKVAAVDWDYVDRSIHREVEASFGLDVGRGQGILFWALARVPETWQDDSLLVLSVLEAVTGLIVLVKSPSALDPNISKSLKFMIDAGIHQKMVDVYFDQADASNVINNDTILRDVAFHYFGVYLENYPQHFFHLPEPMRKTAMRRITASVTLTSVAWEYHTSRRELWIICSAPRILLLPNLLQGPGSYLSPLLFIPSELRSVEALRTLTTILGGPKRITCPDPVAFEHEAAATRVLYMVLVTFREKFFRDLVIHADSHWLAPLASAAMDLLKAIFDAEWSPLPQEDRFEDGVAPSDQSCLPNEERLQLMLPRTHWNLTLPFPQHPIVALFKEPAVHTFVPWLLAPGCRFGSFGLEDSDQYDRRITQLCLQRHELRAFVISKLKDFKQNHPETFEKSRLEDYLTALERAQTYSPFFDDAWYPDPVRDSSGPLPDQ